MVVFESSLRESQLVNLDVNTEVLDVCESTQHSGDEMEDYCGKEVVVDSDDEGEVQNEDVNLVNGGFPVIGRLSRRNATGLLRRRQVHAGCFQRVGNKVSEDVHPDLARIKKIDNRFQEHHEVVDSVVSRSPDQNQILLDQDFLNLIRESWTEESFDERKLSSQGSKFISSGNYTDYESKLAEFKYVESPEDAESHDKALRFVDHYLSINDLGSYKDIQNRKTHMIKSPPSLRSKGSQSLANRVKLGSSASKLKTFDWAANQIEKDDYTSLRMNKDPIFEFEDEKSGCLSVNQESENVKLKNKISNFKSKEKLSGNMLSTNDLDTDTDILNSNDSSNIGSNSGIHIAFDSMESDKQLNAGLSMQNVEKVEQFSLVPDALDIGLDTQVAAEAMEELIHAVPPRFDACFTHQGSDNRLLDNKCKSNHVANHEETFVGWRSKGKRSKCIKISTFKDKSISLSSAKQNQNQRRTIVHSLVTTKLMTEKLTNEEFLNSSNPGKTRNRNFGARPWITVQQEKCGISDQCSLKEFQKHHRLCGKRSVEKTDGIKLDSSLKRRKMISFNEDAHTCLKSDFGSSLKVKTDAAKGKENSNLNVDDKSFSKLNLWVYPKGKRTSLRMPHLSISSSNECSPSAEIENNVDRYPTMKDKTCNGLTKLLVYNRRRKFPLGSDQIGSSLRAVDLISSVNDSAVSDKQVQILVGSDSGKPLMQCGVLDDWKSSSVDASNNIKSNLLSSEPSTTLQVLEGSDKRKQPLNPSSRSPLVKELVRLGYTESLPDFLPKDSRRRRALKKFCILFSQNLETSTLKQQKKIVSGLGLSIASCCSNATHFVADRFVRTRNMMEAIALGKPVVTHLWLESCEQAGYVINEKNFILRDEKKEKEIGFNMPVSLGRAIMLPLLKGRRVFITPNVKPCIDVINDLVKAVQGEAIQNLLTDKMKDKLIRDDLLIISCKEDYTICLQFLEKGASIYDSELLLNGIVTQKLEYQRYQLFKDFKENGHSCFP